MTVREIWKLGDLAYLGEKNTLSKIAGPGLTSAGSFEVLSSKNESGIAQLFVRSLNRAT